MDLPAQGSCEDRVNLLNRFADRNSASHGGKTATPSIAIAGLSVLLLARGFLFFAIFAFLEFEHYVRSLTFLVIMGAVFCGSAPC